MMPTIAAPRGAATAGQLQVVRGRSQLAVRAAAIEELCVAVVTGIEPSADVDDGRVTISYPRFSIAGLFAEHRAEIRLTSSLPWEVSLARGVAGAALDLRGLELTGLRIDGGASNVRLWLPALRHDLRIRIAGGASGLAVLRPGGSGVVVRLDKGTSRLTLDGERYGAIGGDTTLESRGEPGCARYEIEIRGGASDLTIAGADDGHARSTHRDPAEPEPEEEERS